MPGNEKQPLPRSEPSPFAAGLAAQIAARGPMTLAAFMAQAGGHYYASGDPFGTKGDFTTAPEISQMFGELIGAWIADLWMRAGRPAQAQVAELGPGRGTLAADVMRALSTWPECRAALSLHLVETSPALRKIQAGTLRDITTPAWHGDVAQVPPAPTFFIANEFLDALPVHQYLFTEGRWRERLVDFDTAAGAFVFTLAAEAAAVSLPSRYTPPHEGDIFETSPASHAVIETVAAQLAQKGGAALFIDYGPAKPFYGDTTQGYYRHVREGILANPGLQDVTANVDFPALAETAAKKARVHGPVTQGEFLLRLGIGQRAEALSRKASPAQAAAAGHALRRLVSPEAMGRMFKVMAITPENSDIVPAGFGEGA